MGGRFLIRTAAGVISIATGLGLLTYFTVTEMMGGPYYQDTSGN